MIQFNKSLLFLKFLLSYYEMHYIFFLYIYCCTQKNNFLYCRIFYSIRCNGFLTQRNNRVRGSFQDELFRLISIGIKSDKYIDIIVTNKTAAIVSICLLQLMYNNCNACFFNQELFYTSCLLFCDHRSVIGFSFFF